MTVISLILFLFYDIYPVQEIKKKNKNQIPNHVEMRESKYRNVILSEKFIEYWAIFYFLNISHKLCLPLFQNFFDTWILFLIVQF
jgi:hypothetical protein